MFDADKKMLFWNVIVQMKDGRLVSSMARGTEFNTALVWFDRATYIRASSDRDHIVEFYDNPSNSYSDFLVKECMLKKKYGIE